MKGIANITVKSADGRIKTRREEHNTITTAYKDKNAGRLAALKWGRTSFMSTSADDFKAVWLHGETLDDLCDIQTPLLVGGQAAKASGVSWQYAAPLNASVDEGTKTISNTWAWSIEEATTIKALSLHNSGVTSVDFGNGSNYNCIQTLMKLTDTSFYVPGFCYHYGSSYRNYRYRAPSIAEPTLSVQELKYILSGQTAASPKQALPLYNKEFLIGEKRNSEVPTLVAATSTGTLTVVADENIANKSYTAKRTFAISQFENLGSPASSSYGYYVFTLPSPAVDWVFIIDATNVNVYQLPRTATEGTISRVTSFPDNSPSYPIYFVCGNMAYSHVAQDDGRAYVFSCKDDGDWRVDEAQLFNTNTGGSSDYGVFLPYVKRSDANGAYQLGINYEEDTTTWILSLGGYMRYIHNTILNLSSPLELAAGDTLSISYTVTVGEEAGA